MSNHTTKKHKKSKERVITLNVFVYTE